MTHDEPTFHCLECFDEPHGWRLHWCRGAGTSRVAVEDKGSRFMGMATRECGRMKRHPPHSFTDPCACRDTNPVIARHRERLASYQAQAAARPRTGRAQ